MFLVTRYTIQNINNFFENRRVTPIFAIRKTKSSFSCHAEVAHLVEHDLAKVGVASSSLVFRSIQNS